MKDLVHKSVEKILLIGAGFRNKGAEAMSLTAIRHFNSLYPGCRITLASYSKKECLSYGEHAVSPLHSGEPPVKFELIKNTKKILHPIRVFLSFFLPFEKARHFLTSGDLYLQRFSEADIVVDLSGFAMSDHRSFLRRLVYCFEIFTSRCFRRPFVIFTQAVGPFEKLSTRLAARLFLPRADILIARGAGTYKHLKKIGIDRKMPITVCSDSAFLFEPASKEFEEGKKLLGKALTQDKPLFGVVPNINIYYRTMPQDEQNAYIQMLVQLCDHVRSVLNARLVFICHERYEYRKDDHWLMQQVAKQVESPETIISIDGNYTAGVLKAVIGNLDFVAASRFHSLVAAISMATPFFALGWAHKYIELAEEAGVGASALDFRGLSGSQLLEAIDKAWDNRKETRKHLEIQHDRLYNSAEKAYRLVAQKYPARNA